MSGPENLSPPLSLEPLSGPVSASEEEDMGRPVVLITGLSGAGLSVSLKALEDLGYEAVDNLRLSLLPALISLDEAANPRPLAVVVDSRTADFTADALLSRLQRLVADRNIRVRLLFLDCTDEELQRRYTETRRGHPLARERPVQDGIAHERVLLSLLRDRADVSIDTTGLSIHDLRRQLRGHFRLESAPELQVFVTSFSFRRGLPREADLVFDVRFLVNPHYTPALRPLTGRDEGVAAAVAADPDFGAFFQGLTQLLDLMLGRFRHEGKSYLTLAVGCTGGRHRSVFVAERLAAWLRTRGLSVGLTHRDLERNEPPPG